MVEVGFAHFHGRVPRVFVLDVAAEAAPFSHIVV